MSSTWTVAFFVQVCLLLVLQRWEAQGEGHQPRIWRWRCRQGVGQEVVRRRPWGQVQVRSHGREGQGPLRQGKLITSFEEFVLAFQFSNILRFFTQLATFVIAGDDCLQEEAQGPNRSASQTCLRRRGRGRRRRRWRRRRINSNNLRKLKCCWETVLQPSPPSVHT